MALQWLILEYVVAAEAAIAVLLTLPWPKTIRSRIVALISKLLQPFASLIPFAVFNLLDLYWKNEHRLKCSSEVCTEEERVHYERSVYKAQRNVILCVSVCFLYWCMHHICKYHKQIKQLEDVEKKAKDL
ncbi:uncharacterized protein LOC110098666 [Dendrobium catenatum]|uniref:Endoplasmic reticulum transmembrane protein n=2 Tax=Dendrobium TaxID=37818 RepID=A0A8T3B6W1_DENNO|nr:uncharacterized protein LOC110098666 [Dendrobium catenatum]KAI0507153.1 hypothetical protein KFK09_013273 [Dendrobium nobile]PKU82765.1 hypothetical protein MA16_Dca015162 [Dendrobium catenatum]